MNSILRTVLAVLMTVFALSAMAAEPSLWERFKNYAHDQKKAAVADGRKAIAETDKNIASLRKEIARSTGEAKAMHQRNMKELQAKKKVAQTHLAKMGKSTSGAWDATKDGFANAYKDLADSYDKAAAAVKK